MNGANASTFFQQRFSNMLLEDASYLKLRTVQLTYAIPTRKIMPWLRSLSVFATATNLLTITGYSGYDPEVSITTGAMSPNVDYAAYPSCKTWSFGINIGF
ncbi:hypothetical protein FACS1894159_11390 [Bacteroidia bacterium]|nr:hypothetical protein FACS1894159_11390 [Bacteroidia bacterium]